MLPKLRKIHLYLGCLFAPMLILFLVTGCLQMLELHEPDKGGYKPAPVVYSLAQVHMHQRYSSPGNFPQPSTYLKAFILVMSAGLLCTILLGIFMAFKVNKNKVFVWLCLLSGILIPVVFLWMAKGAK